MSTCSICGEYATVDIYQMCSTCAASRPEVNRFGERICEHGVTVGAYCHPCNNEEVNKMNECKHLMIRWDENGKCTEMDCARKDEGYGLPCFDCDTGDVLCKGYVEKEEQ